MTQVEVTKTESDGQVGKRLLADVDRLMQSVRTRAYELFERRGGGPGTGLDDWLQAEAELLLPIKIDATQEAGKYTIRISLPGFSTKDLKVYRVGNRLVLKGAAGSEKSEKEGVSSEQHQNVFCQWPLPAGAHADQIKANYKHEMLTISIPVDVKSETSDAKSKASSATAAAA